MPAITIVVANSKGGVGKSATSSFLCSEASVRHIRTLAVDLDPQGSLTRYLDRDDCTGEAFAAALESEEVVEAEVAINTRFPFIDLLAAGPQLDARIELQALPHVEVRLKILFQDLHYADRYDLIVVDTRPSLGRLTLNAMNLPGARVIVPTRDDDNAIDGLRSTLAIVRQVQRLSNPSVQCAGILRTLVARGGRTALQRDANEWFTTYYPELILQHVLPASEPFRQAMVARAPIRPFLRATMRDDLDATFTEICERVGLDLLQAETRHAASSELPMTTAVA